MCTVILLRRPGHNWPLIFAGNRDEMKTRAWAPPARHWPDRPEVVAGLDETAGGSWLGVNEHGLLAVVLNRIGSLGPLAGKRSRGELVLEALDSADAGAAAEQLSYLDPQAYRSFNLVLADNQDAYWLRHRGDDGPGVVEVLPLPSGLSMITAFDRNDPLSARTARFLPEFESVLPPDPDLEDWDSWQELMARTDADDPHAAMTVRTPAGFETTSGSLIALPAPGYHLPSGELAETAWLFAAGAPDRTPYEPIEF